MKKRLVVFLVNHNFDRLAYFVSHKDYEEYAGSILRERLIKAIELINNKDYSNNNIRCFDIG